MAEEPFGPLGLNRMLARVCAVVNMTAFHPTKAGEDDWLPGDWPGRPRPDGDE